MYGRVLLSQEQHHPVRGLSDTLFKSCRSPPVLMVLDWPGPLLILGPLPVLSLPTQHSLDGLLWMPQWEGLQIQSRRVHSRTTHKTAPTWRQDEISQLHHCLMAHSYAHLLVRHSGSHTSYTTLTKGTFVVDFGRVRESAPV